MMVSTVFENTLSNGEEDYSGKMELKTLLPLSGNLNRTIVGGEDEGFGIINQYKYQNGEMEDNRKQELFGRQYRGDGIQHISA